MLDFIKKYKLTILVVALLIIGVGTYFGIKYYRNNIGTYEPYSEEVENQIVKYDDNQYKVIYKDDIDVYRAYYKEFMNLLANDPSKAYNVLTSSTKTSLYNDNYENFLAYQKTLDKKVLLSSDIVKYKKEQNKVSVIDKYENKYVFYENGVWNFTVEMFK